MLLVVEHISIEDMPDTGMFSIKLPGMRLPFVEKHFVDATIRQEAASERMYPIEQTRRLIPKPHLALVPLDVVGLHFGPSVLYVTRARFRMGSDAQAKRRSDQPSLPDAVHRSVSLSSRHGKGVAP
jgi:hypothetical protein